MKFLAFFIVFWTVVSFSWDSLTIKLPKTRVWQTVEIIVLAPVVVWRWIKFGVTKIKNRNSRG